MHSMYVHCHRQLNTHMYPQLIEQLSKHRSAIGLNFPLRQLKLTISWLCCVWESLRSYYVESKTHTLMVLVNQILPRCCLFILQCCDQLVSPLLPVPDSPRDIPCLHQQPVPDSSGGYARCHVSSPQRRPATPTGQDISPHCH